MGLDVAITNADGSPAMVEINDKKLDIYIDKPNTASLKVSRVHSVSADAAIDISYKGKVVFRGILETPAPDKADNIDFSFIDVVQILEQRMAQTCTYLAGTAIEDILSSDPPSLVAGAPLGLLYLANSLVPHGWLQQFLGSPYIFKCRGYGTTNFPAVAHAYKDGVELTEKATLDDLKIAPYTGYFQDANYLYIGGSETTIDAFAILLDTKPVPGTWYDAGCYAVVGGEYVIAANTWRIPDAGEHSIFGPVVDIYKDNTLKFTNHGSKYNMADNTFYQDDYGLYLKIPDAETLTDYLITIPNWKDTGIRLGDVSIEGWTFDSDFVLDEESIASNIEKLFSNVYAAEPEYIYNVDGSTSLNVVEALGRGSEAAPVHTWRMEELINFKTSYNREALANCVIAVGAGDPAIHAAAGQVEARAVWRETSASYQVEEEYTLRETLDREMAKYTDPRSYSFKTVPVYGLRGGDWVKILTAKQKQANIYSQIQKISYSGEDSMEVTLGHRQREIGDVWDLVKEAT